MIDERERFERTFELFEMPEPAFERMYRRRDARIRNQRMAAGLVGLAVAVATTVIVGRLLASGRTEPDVSATTPTPSALPSPEPVIGGPGVRFESPTYGYSIELPTGWVATPTGLPWMWRGERRSDVIQANGPTWSFNVTIASIEVPPAHDGESFLRGQENEFAEIKRASCAGSSLQVEAISLGGVDARLSTACDGEVFVTGLVGPRSYVISTNGPVGDHLQAFRSVLDTIEFQPELATAGQSVIAWRGIWPHTTRAEALAAQQRAETGDPEATWQVDRNQEGIVARRFLTEVLGWSVRESGVSYVPSDSEQAWEAEVVEWYFIRCAPGQTNPLYPDDDCAPTIDDTHYVQVVVRAEQLVRRGREGVWSITGYEEVAPYEQTTPPPMPEVRNLVERFLAARVAGQDAEGFLSRRERSSFPLLYETTAGLSYERAEIERVIGPEWPFAHLEFFVRLTTAGDDVAVRQRISAFQDGDRIWLDNYWTTTENGRVVDSPFG